MVADHLDAAEEPTADSPEQTGRVEWFHQATVAVAARLPFGLNRIVAPSFLGYAVINGCTFGLDLGLLTVLRSGLHWPLPVAITLSYLVAFGLSFVLNRSLNFVSHAPLGRQTALYVVVIAINYLVCILGVGAGLAALGVEYHLARLIAGACEAVFMYSAMRWVVFRDA
jgi:putative flippase GtrA